MGLKVRWSAHLRRPPAVPRANQSESRPGKESGGRGGGSRINCPVNRLNFRRPANALASVAAACATTGTGGKACRRYRPSHAASLAQRSQRGCSPVVAGVGGGLKRVRIAAIASTPSVTTASACFQNSGRDHGSNVSHVARPGVGGSQRRRNGRPQPAIKYGAAGHRATRR